MARSHQALLLGADSAGRLKGIVVMEMLGTAAQLRSAVTMTRADMERRGLNVTVDSMGVRRVLAP